MVIFMRTYWAIGFQLTVIFWVPYFETNHQKHRSYTLAPKVNRPCVTFSRFSFGQSL